MKSLTRQILLKALARIAPRTRPSGPRAARLLLTPLEDRTVPDGSGRPLPLPYIFVGGATGAPPLVRAYHADTGALAFERQPFAAGFTGGVRVTAGDVNHDGIPDLIAAAGPGAGPHVKVYDGTSGELIAGPLGSFYAYDAGFTGGVHVASGDVDGDGWADVITAAGPGAGPHVKVFSGRTGGELASFYAFAPGFAGGATVAAADFTGDGRADLVVGAGPGAGPHVEVFDLSTGGPIPGPLGSFYAFDPAVTAGVDVGADFLAGDVTGDGRADLVVGLGAGSGSRVRVFDGATGAVASDFSPFGAGMTAGVRVALAYVSDDDRADVVVGTGSGGPGQVKVFDGATGVELPAPMGSYAPFGAGYTGGLYVGASNDPPIVAPGGPDGPGGPVTPVPPDGPDGPGGSGTDVVTITADQNASEPGGRGWFTVHRGAPGADLTVHYSAPGGTATNGTDYAFLDGSVTIPSGLMSARLYVDPVDDALDEGPETVVVALAGGGGYTVGGGSATIELSDDDHSGLWLDTDADPAVKGEEVTFWLPEDGPEYASVEWDPDYDGVTFRPAPGATDWWFATTYATTGTRTVAARAAPVGGAVQLVTLPVTVKAPPPVLTVPDELAATVGVPTVLPAEATAEAGIASVGWAFSFYSDDYEWDFEPDPTLTSLNPTYTFSHAGEWDVQVTVTDNAGNSSDGWFHVTVAPEPEAAITTGGPVDEGQPVTFTSRVLDPDTLDTVTVYANWTGAGDAPFDQLNPGDFTINPDGSVSFTHVYSATAPQTVFPAQIRVEDEWGVSEEYTVAVTVRDVKPRATVTAGRQASVIRTDATGPDLNLWAIGPGQALAFTDVQIASPFDASQVTYYWALDGQAAVATASPHFLLPDYTGSRVYEVEAWLVDRGGTEGDHTRLTVSVENGGTPQSGGPVVGLDLVYGTVLIQQDGVMPHYGRFNYIPLIMREGWAPDTALVVEVRLEPSTLAYARSIGATVRYSYTVSVYDVEEHTFGLPNNVLLFDQAYIGAGATITVDMPQALHTDRSISVRPTVQLIKDGAVVANGGALGWVSAQTVKTLTTGQQLVEGIQALCALAEQLGTRGQALVNAVLDRPTVVPAVLLEGLKQGAEAFVAELTTGDGWKEPLLTWLLGNADPAILNVFQNPNWGDPNTYVNFLLQYGGLTIDHVMDVVRQQLGAGNLAALDRVAEWFRNPDGTLITDSAQFIQKVQAGGGDLEGGLDGVLQNPALLFEDVKDALKKEAVAALKKLSAQVLAKFVPGAAVVSSVVGAVNWVLTNQAQLTGLFAKVMEAIDQAVLATPSTQAAATAAVADRVKAGLKQAVPVILGAAAAQFGLGNLPADLRKAVGFVPAKVDKALRDVVSKIAAKVSTAVGGAGVPGGTKGGLFDGKLAPERQFTYEGVTYVLWVASDQTGTKVKVAKVKPGGGYEFIGDLTAASFTAAQKAGVTGTAQQHISGLIAAAKAFQAGSKQRGPAGTNVIAGLQAQRDAIAPVVAPTPGVVSDPSGAEDKVIADILNDACMALNAGCFGAGTRLLTRRGWVPVELLSVGDELASRTDRDPSGEVEWKPVEACFRRTGRVLHLHFPDGQVIRTTPEHPFWVEGRGWTAAGALAAGDRVATLSGAWVPIREVYDTQEWEPVYNVRVADHHTYFVGDDGWGFAAWAHNTCDDAFVALAASPEMQSRGVTLEQLRSIRDLKTTFSPAYKVKHTSLKEFKYAIEIILDRAGYLPTGRHLSDVTLLTVKQAAEVPKRPTIQLDPSLENPYAEGTSAHAKFQSKVLGDPVLLGYYKRILALDQWEFATLGTNTSSRLVQQLPGGINAARFKGLAYQLGRTEAYKGLGTLREVEKPLGSDSGEVDIALTDYQLVDAKAWTQSWWGGMSQGDRDKQIGKLVAQVRKYLNATSVTPYKLRLEFEYFVPPEVQNMINNLAALPEYAGRIETVVRT